MMQNGENYTKVNGTLTQSSPIWSENVGNNYLAWKFGIKYLCLLSSFKLKP